MTSTNCERTLFQQALADLTQTYTFEKPRFQNFPIPSDVIKFMLNDICNPKARGKLVKTCKYFFSKKPFIPLHNLDFGALRKKLILKILGVPNSKIWLTGEFFISSLLTNTYFPLSNIFEKIFRCDITVLDISKQNILFNEFIFFTSSTTLESINLNMVSITDSGQYVSLQTLCKYLPNIKKFSYVYNPNVTGALSIIPVPNFTRLQRFRVVNLPYSLDYKVFKKFIKNHPKTDIDIKYITLPDEHIFFSYTIRLQEKFDKALKIVSKEESIVAVKFPYL